MDRSIDRQVGFCLRGRSADRSTFYEARPVFSLVDRSRGSIDRSIDIDYDDLDLSFLLASVVTHNHACERARRRRDKTGGKWTMTI